MKNRKGKNQTDAPAAKPFSIEQYNSRTDRRTSQNGSLMFSAFVFVVALVLAIAAGYLITGAFTVWVVLVGFALACLAEMSIHIAMQWEKVVVLRFGKLNRVVGPGLYFTIPVIEHGTIRVDQRTIATPFYAEKTLTADLVPVTVDAVLFWVVWDAEKACTEVEDYYAAVSFLAQTALREAVGRSTVAEVALRRDQLDAEIKDDIEKEAAGWGVDIISVKVRDIVIPDELQEVMSLEAQADCEKNARMTVVGVEAELAEMLAEAARVYGDPEAALKLRTMLMQYDTVKKSKGTVVTVPTAMSDGFTDSAMMNGDRTTER